jgi:predicted regulator of amino acid metabolism with ACT domain
MWNIPEKVVTITTDYIIEIEKLRKKYEKRDDILYISDIQKKKLYMSCFGVIRSLGIQMRQSIKQNRNMEEKCIKVPQKFTCKRCKPINIHTKDFTYLRHERVDIFTIDSIPDDIYDFLKSENRVVYEKGELISKYWVENKCRCFTCDLVRYSYRNYSMKDALPSKIWNEKKFIPVTSSWSKLTYHEYISSYDWYTTYDNLIVDLENKQWKRMY